MKLWKTFIRCIVNCCFEVKWLYKSLTVSQVFTINFLCNLSLNKYCQTFIKPKISPIKTSNQVASPRVSNFMDGCCNLWFVTCDYCWWNKCKKRIFHSTKWEWGRLNKDIILTPCIWNSNIFFNLIKIILKSFKIRFCSCNLLRFCNKIDSFSKRNFLKISNSKSYKIWWNSYLVLKMMLGMCSIVNRRQSIISTHFDSIFFWSNHGCFICCFDCRSVLERCDRSASYCLALGK